MSPNHADGMANSVDPDQTAPLEAVWSGSALFAQAYLSENLGSLSTVTNQYLVHILLPATDNCYTIMYNKHIEHTFQGIVIKSP